MQTVFWSVLCAIAVEDLFVFIHSNMHNISTHDLSLVHMYKNCNNFYSRYIHSFTNFNTIYFQNLSIFKTLLCQGVKHCVFYMKNVRHMCFPIQKHIKTHMFWLPVADIPPVNVLEKYLLFPIYYVAFIDVLIDIEKYWEIIIRGSIYFISFISPIAFIDVL
jgi:hypothetical protein